MLTIFACPKPFRGHVSIIQRNAIKSWTLLQPRPEIILFGDEEGTAEVCKEFGLRHIPEVERNEYGTPLLSSLFASADSTASNSTLCYINSDIILTTDFMPSVQNISKRWDRFLIVGRRWNVDIDHLWDFEKGDWEERLKEYVSSFGNVDCWCAIDYFVFNKGLFHGIPDFALGRTCWDNWLIYYARCQKKVPVIDASKVIIAIHQNHGYTHHLGGISGIFYGPEAQHNLQLAGRRSLFCVADATHILSQKGIAPALGFPYLWRRVYTMSTFYPIFLPLRWVLDIFLGITRGIRFKFGLTLSDPSLVKGTVVNRCEVTKHHQQQSYDKGVPKDS